VADRRGHLHVGRLQRQQEFGRHDNCKRHDCDHSGGLVNDCADGKHDSNSDEDDGGSRDDCRCDFDIDIDIDIDIDNTCARRRGEGAGPQALGELLSLSASAEVCDPATLTASSGPARGALTKTVTDLIGADLFVGNDDPGYTTVEAVTVNGSTAQVTSCWWDTGVLYGPPAEAGGPPIVMNNKQVTARFETTLAFEEGRWLTSEAKRVARVEGVNQCPPKV
jgi:hypothetical protein